MSRIENWNSTSYPFAEEPLLWFDRPNEGRTQFFGTNGDDRLKGTDGGDHFDMRSGGADVVRGGDGNDTFDYGNTFGSGDRVVGGAGTDTLAAYTSGSSVDLTNSNLSGVEKIRFYGGDANVVNVSSDVDSLNIFTVGGKLILRVSDDNSNDFRARGSAGADTIAMGAGDDVLIGRSGPDTLTGGMGADIFKYFSYLDSAEFSGFDKILDFESGDVIRLPKGFNYMLSDDTASLGDVFVSFDETQNVTMISVNLGHGGDKRFEIDLAGDIRDISLHNNHLFIGVEGALVI